ncbi:MAG: hypothetical protein ACK47Z_16760, partial [Paracoccaceae bacterium]
ASGQSLGDDKLGEKFGVGHAAPLPRPWTVWTVVWAGPATLPGAAEERIAGFAWTLVLDA